MDKLPGTQFGGVKKTVCQVEFRNGRYEGKRKRKGRRVNRKQVKNEQNREGLVDRNDNETLENFTPHQQ